MSNRIRISTLALTLFLFSGCVTQQVVTENRIPLPDWINNLPEDDGKYYYFVGMETNAGDQRSGFAGAEADAVGKLTRMLQTGITTDYERLRSEIELPHDAEVRDTGSYVRNQISKYSREITLGANTIKKHQEMVQLNSWGKRGFNCYVLVRYSRDEYRRIKSRIIGIDPDIEKGIECLVGKPCEECVDYFSSLAKRKSRDDQAHYYLALVYDRCDKKIDAFYAYKAFIAMSPKSGTLRNKADVRMRDLKQDVIVRLIEEADLLAGKHQFKKCLKNLERAYELLPIAVTDDKIVDKYTRYAIRQLVQELTLDTKSLKEKTVAVADFGNMKREVVAEGVPIMVTEEICDALTNISDLKVVERVSLPNILKEIEIAMTGIISEESRKELGNIVNAETMVVGRVGNVRSSLRIYAKLVLVEKGIILASKSINLLGYDIPDTAKDASFNISVRTGRDRYRIGDTAKIYLRSNRDCYVTVLNLRSNGEIFRLFPNKYDHDNFIRANTEYTVPAGNAIYELSISDPPGKESIKAIATSRPITLDEIESAISADTNVLTRSAPGITRGQDSFFREVSNAEMRGWHNVLRGMTYRAMEPTLKEDAVYNETEYAPSGSSLNFEYAVGSSLFETRR
ncbi:MAG: DUF4384 domain-containing protein [Candidatus Scalindua sp.]